MDSISKIVNSVVKKNIGSTNYYQAILKKNWSDILGIELSDKCFPLKIEKNKLFIISNSSTLNHHLLIIKKDVLDKINKYLGVKFIKDIFLLNGNIDELFLNKEDKDNINVDKLILDTIVSEQEYSYIERILSFISDEKLKRKIGEILLVDCKYRIFLEETGCKKCKLCSRMVEKNQEYCWFCNQDYEVKLMNDLEQIILQVPHINFTDCQKYLKCDRITYDKIKHNLMNKYKDKINSNNYERKDILLYELLKIEYK